METQTHILAGTGPKIKIRLSDPSKKSKVIVVGTKGTKSVNLSSKNDINFAA